MPVNQSENTKDKDGELVTRKQPFGLQLAVVFAVVLILLPLLPAFITNLAYSFGGHAPKIYWYLSRSGGFIALSILWVSMAMGLGLTNKLARVWPGAPTAFAIHEYVSLLGLLFAAYHGLVLMGDHYVDFSLPRLLVPFSIRYEPFWVGLGQVAFYTWIIVLISFYVRQHIGQKTWRMIHYTNFATYVMGSLHGLFSGTDGTAGWAHWYYGISTGTLIALVVYRVYITIHKQPASRSKPVRQPEHSSPVPVAVTAASTTPEMDPQAPSLELVSSPPDSPAPTVQPIPVAEPILASDPMLVSTVTESIPQPLMIEQEEVPTSEYVMTETELPVPDQTPIVIKLFEKVRIPSADPTLPRNQKMNLHRTAYLEPVTVPSLKIKGVIQSEESQSAEREKVVIPNIRVGVDAQSKQTQLPPLILRIKENLHPKSAQPSLVINARKRDEIQES